MKKRLAGVVGLLFMTYLLSGCNVMQAKNDSQDYSTGNVIITETGETLVKEQPTETPTPIETPSKSADEEFGVLPSPNVVPEVEVTEPEQEQVVTEIDQTSPEDGKLQLVFMGDSIFDNNRDGTGIPYMTAELCDANVANMAIGGTCAAIEIDEQYENDKWTSSSLVGIVKAIMGQVSTDPFQGTRAQQIIDNKEVDFSKTDYFIVEYGMNDFLRATPIKNESNDFDIRTYVGALRYAVSNLKDVAPDATIILCGPNYAQFFHQGVFIGDGNSLNTGYGTLFDYKGICQYVSNEQHTEFLDAYLDLGIDSYTAEDYLEDGVHLTEAGRKVYAEALAKKILAIEEEKNN